MPQNQNSNSLIFLNIRTTLFYFLTVIAILVVAFPWLYEIKTKAGIDISPGRHAGTFFEKHTRGIFKCEWLYPYHCDRSHLK
ncbi:MAG: hypothetical protein RMY16_08085 [Nostoc sp. DedQUE12b]|uniref:hypothetical protein n=1 Tax=unclassified Nostoc TaxID=2593658 RepID=UPI002AD3C516|nr:MULTISPECIES: hypothetical protein [unclassified Nostoc]MDZ7953078.1 hypothetical protein [Nostoc sp. DedQUE09]MDZ8085542.1 hypothetical protein [Nostoc sp. DedQUE12b]